MRVKVAVVIVAASLLAGCGNVNAALKELSEAQRLSADLLVEFTKGADASNRAVMADTDASSTTFAHEADEAKLVVQKDVDALGPILQSLKFTEESRLLQEFATSYAEYKKLDRLILDLAVENTNLKAQRLSFGPAQAAADEFRDSLEAMTSAVPATDAWRLKAVIATAIAAVRDIQVLQAPHIADPDDAAMTSLEKRMAASESVARNALQTLTTLVDPRSRPRLATAAAALDRFMSLNSQIIGLSRHNSNVRSLALSLDQKRKLIEPCEQSLRALRSALAKRGYRVGRY